MSVDDFEMTTDELLKLQLDLDRVARTAVPHAAREGLNKSAFLGRFAFQGAIRERLINRNAHTVRRVGVTKARGTNLATMEAVLGHPEAYMRTQEVGGMDRGAVPMPAASGEASKPRFRLVKRRFRMRAIALARRGRKGSKRQRNAASIRMAQRAGRKFVFLHTDKAKGIFSLSGKRKLKFKMIWNMTKGSRFIKPTPTLEPALRRIDRDLPRIHVNAIKNQLRRRRLMGF